MRMRKKHNLENRLARQSVYLVDIDTSEKDARVASLNRTPLDFAKLFSNDNPVWLEIGCGKGGFAIQTAKQNPNVNVVAVEKISNVIIAACEAAEAEKVENLRFLNCGAEYLLKYIPDCSVEKIFLNFSCPFPPHSYENRRLTYKSFLEIYKKILLPNGTVCQKTDNEAFFDFSAESFLENGFLVQNVCRDLHHSNFEGNVMTEYETMFAKKGLPIFRLEAVLDQNFCADKK